ncbi:Mitogen-Activated Protein Kinase Kinase Kinase 8 [Stygiomarasmius scandens]|uniref:Mitogen-Activated Protein Kinase Kinase Kinase 8 n=1 Tax=Marasmiellus scandens TaxID=2682957 RepID=A0ABR1IX30_9AGAR
MSPTTMPTGAPRHYGSQRAQYCPRPPPAVSRHQRHLPSHPSNATSSSGAHMTAEQTFSSSTEASAPSWSMTRPQSAWSVRTDQAPISPSGCPPSRTRHVSERPRPRNTIPLPPQVSDDVDVIPLLKSGSGIIIDLKMAPAALYRHSELRGWNSYLSQPATCPAIPSMTLVHPALPWAVTVHRSRYEWVTVEDVLRRLLEAVREPVNAQLVEEDWNATRMNGARTMSDYLPGSRLAGLRKSRRGEDVWYMDVI